MKGSYMFKHAKVVEIEKKYQEYLTLLDQFVDEIASQFVREYRSPVDNNTTIDSLYKWFSLCVDNENIESVILCKIRKEIPEV